MSMHTVKGNISICVQSIPVIRDPAFYKVTNHMQDHYRKAGSMHREQRKSDPFVSPFLIG